MAGMRLGGKVAREMAKKVVESRPELRRFYEDLDLEENHTEVYDSKDGNRESREDSPVRTSMRRRNNSPRADSEEYDSSPESHRPQRSNEEVRRRPFEEQEVYESNEYEYDNDDYGWEEEAAYETGQFEDEEEYEYEPSNEPDFRSEQRSDRDVRPRASVAPSQTGLHGRTAVLKVNTFDFDESCPDRADRHYIRSKEQEAAFKRYSMELQPKTAGKRRVKRTTKDCSPGRTSAKPTRKYDPRAYSVDAKSRPLRDAHSRGLSDNDKEFMRNLHSRTRGSAVNRPADRFFGDTLAHKESMRKELATKRSEPDDRPESWVQRATRRHQEEHPEHRPDESTTTKYIRRLEDEIDHLRSSVRELKGSQPEPESSRRPAEAFASEEADAREFSYKTGERSVREAANSASLADHLAEKSGAAASSAAAAGRRDDDDTDDNDDDVATGKYSDDRYLDYDAKMDEVSEHRQAGAGYDSDLERERERERAAAMEAGGLQEAAGALALTDEDRLLRHWKHDDAWMAEYRTAEDHPVAEDSGKGKAKKVYEEDTSSLADEEEAPGGAGIASSSAAHSLVDYGGPDEVPLDALLARYRKEASRGGHAAPGPPPAHMHEVTTYHSDGESEYLWADEEPSGRARSAGRGRGAWVEGHEDHHSGCMHYLGEGLAYGDHGDGFPRPSGMRVEKHVRKEPFSFDGRERARSKSIMQERLEQDLAIQAEKEEMHRRANFKAKPLPKSTREPRYLYLLEEALFQREQNVAQRKARLAEMEKPFSFWHRSQAAVAAREDMSRHARQRRADSQRRAAFRAKDVPRSTSEARYHLMEAADERRRQARKHEAYEKWAAAKLPPRMQKWQEIAEQHKEGQQVARARHKFQPQATGRRLGHVPDFTVQHEKFREELLVVKKSRPATQAQPFRLHKHRSAQDRMRKTFVDIALDETALPEQRWPFTAHGRAKVPRAPKPAMVPMSEADLTRMETKLQQARRLAVKEQMEAGQYDDRETQEARAREKALKAAERRAAAWVASQRRLLDAKGTEGDDAEDLDALSSGKILSDHDATEKKDDPKVEGAIPPMHVKARLAQEEEKAKNVVEQILVQNDVYNYVED